MPNPSILVDAHVHFHGCFERRDFLDHAARNFAAVRGRNGTASQAPGVLMLTECAGDRFFRSFRETAGQAWPGGWVLRRTAEENSLLACRDGELELVMVAGSQIVTGGKLELLALGCGRDLPDGRDLAESIEAVRREGGLPVLPWGAGKWWFERGREVAALVRSAEPGKLWLGDNGNRPRVWPRPRLFERAESGGIRILPGSDPLPLPDEVRRVGSFGFRSGGALDPERPAESLLRRMREPEFQPEPFGRGRRIDAFLRTQLSLRLRVRGH